MLYRLNEYIRVGEERLEMYSVSELKQVSPEAIALLLAKGRITEVMMPPLAVLPGWAEKAEKYAEQGIYDIHDLTDAEDVKEAKQWLDPEYESRETSFLGLPMKVPDVYEVVEDDELEE